MNDSFSLLLNLFMTGIVILAVVVLWGLPLYLGLRWAGQKGYSRAWMLFGVHPIGAWIAAAILQVLPARTHCSNCTRLFNRQFIRCPYCDQPNLNQQTDQAGAVKAAPPAVAPVAVVPPAVAVPAYPRAIPAGGNPFAQPAAMPAKAYSQSAPRSKTGTVLIVTLSLLAGVLIFGCAGIAFLVFSLRRSPIPATADVAWPNERFDEAERFDEFEQFEEFGGFDKIEPVEEFEGPGIMREFQASGKNVGPDAQLTRGQTLHAEWAGTWYLAEVREVLPDGNVKIYWPDWDQEEVVSRSRLQFPSEQTTGSQQRNSL